MTGNNFKEMEKSSMIAAEWDEIKSELRFHPLMTSNKIRGKNRYMQFSLDEHSRVKLRGENDYINASHINLTKQYIATQGTDDLLN